MPGLQATLVLSVGKTLRCRPTDAQYRAMYNNGDITSYKVGGINPHGLKMDQEPMALAFSHGPVVRFTTLCAVAASESDLTGTP